MALQINFARKPFKDYRPVNITAAVAGILGVLLFALNIRDDYDFRVRAQGTRGEIARLERQASQTEEVARHTRESLASMRLKDIQAESVSLNALVKERQFSWLLLLSRLERVLPGEVYLTRLTPVVDPDGNAILSLACIGKGPDSIVKTIGELNGSPFFSQAIPGSENDPEKGAPEGYEFHLDVAYRAESAP